MNAASAIAPVIFMLALGFFAKKCKIVSDVQNGGIKKLIFSILLPILVFNATFTMSIDPKYMKISAFMFILQCVTLLLGAIIFRFIKNDYSHISPYMMTTIEGGNAFYPLYISLVGAGFTSYFVLLDVPGIFMIFLVIPLVLAKKSAGGASFGMMLKNIYTNPIVCALLAGIILNLTGVAKLFMKTPVFAVYEALASTATTPIGALILFTLGHSLTIEKDNLAPMLITIIARIVMMGCAIGLAFVLFPWILDDMQLKIAVILFLMSPPAFGLPLVLGGIYKKDSDDAYCATCTSMHMIVTVIVFALIAIFMK